MNCNEEQDKQPAYEVVRVRKLITINLLTGESLNFLLRTSYAHPLNLHEIQKAESNVTKVRQDYLD